MSSIETTQEVAPVKKATKKAVKRKATRKTKTTEVPLTAKQAKELMEKVDAVLAYAERIEERHASRPGLLGLVKSGGEAVVYGGKRAVEVTLHGLSNCVSSTANASRRRTANASGKKQAPSNRGKKKAAK